MKFLTKIFTFETQHLSNFTQAFHFRNIWQLGSGVKHPISKVHTESIWTPDMYKYAISLMIQIIDLLELLLQNSNRTKAASFYSSILLHFIKFNVFMIWTCRSSCSQMFYKVGVLTHFEKFTGKHLRQSLFINK